MNSPYITTCCLGGFQDKSFSLIQKQTPACSVIRHDWNFKSDWLLLSDETKKRASWQQTHQMGLVQTGIKSNPMPTVKYTAGSLMLWAYFSARDPGHLVQMHGIIKYQQIKKNLNLTASVRNRIMGHGWIRTMIQSKHQNQHKNVSLCTK